MIEASLKHWRRAQRERLIAERLAIPDATLRAWRKRMDGYIERAFPGLARSQVALCWPIKNEYDARHLANTLRGRGAVTALPVVVAPKAPLAFREWHPGVELAKGALDIPYPVGSREIVPDAVLLPMNGWDAKGYRLGYGAGFFDRTLASLAKKPAVIGVSYEQARLDTIQPQSWDIPVDYLVTERGVYRRDAEGLAFLGAPQAGDDPSVLSSPVCYAGEIKRD
ncbi:MAG TPA: 5-formyltetrahydrofolate cyclo-ligase [Burkholderiales bacterium]|nr:5-formyltetrahydrofolate cyclo-ligase [Burkholderiales bacterium]